MADLRNPYDQMSLHKLLVATLAGGILDGTYETTIEGRPDRVLKVVTSTPKCVELSIRRPQRIMTFERSANPVRAAFYRLNPVGGPRARDRYLLPDVRSRTRTVPVVRAQACNALAM